MTMKKKLLALTSIVLILGMATLGILAYLTATAEAENTLAAGDVAIELVEQERVDGTIDSVDSNIKEFQNNAKALVPATVDYDAVTTDYWSTANNAVDKIVLVKNTGDNAAYVRVWYAFEEGDDWSLMNINKNEDGITWSDKGTKVIEGTKYHIMSATYVDAVAAGTSSSVGLKQVALSSDATNEDVEAFGTDGYKILVVAQAVQAKGFENAEQALSEAFGYIPPWIEAPKADLRELTGDELVITSLGNYGNYTTVPLELDRGYVFTATEDGDEADESEFRNWHADFVVYADDDIAADSIVLAGNYGSFGWLAFMNDDYPVEKGTEVRLLNDVTGGAISINYYELCTLVEEFYCGAKDLGGNSGTTLTVELRLYETKADAPNEETCEYLLIDKFSHTFK